MSYQLLILTALFSPVKAGDTTQCSGARVLLPAFPLARALFALAHSLALPPAPLNGLLPRFHRQRPELPFAQTSHLPLLVARKPPDVY